MRGDRLPVSGSGVATCTTHGIVTDMAVQADPATRDRAVGEPLPLENGDRLTRGEFERRYAARPDLKEKRN